MKNIKNLLITFRDFPTRPPQCSDFIVRSSFEPCREASLKSRDSRILMINVKKVMTAPQIFLKSVRNKKIQFAKYFV